MRSSPNAAFASRLALTIAAASSAAEFTTRMPRPPPPADALTSTGKPILSAACQRRLVLGLAVIAGHQRYAGLFHQRLSIRISSPSPSSSRRWDRRTRCPAPRRPARIRRSPTGIRSRDARPRRRSRARGDHPLDVEIAVARPRRPEQHGLVGQRDMHRVASASE